MRILEEVDHCEEGKIAGVLRREGLYSSHLTKWRQQRKEGSLNGLRPHKRGKPAKVVDASSRRIAELEKANSQLVHRLQQAELIIDVQKKVSEMLGVCLNPAQEKRKTSCVLVQSWSDSYPFCGVFLLSVEIESVNLLLPDGFPFKEGLHRRSAATYFSLMGTLIIIIIYPNVQIFL